VVRDEEFGSGGKSKETSFKMIAGRSRKHRKVVISGSEMNQGNDRDKPEGRGEGGGERGFLVKMIIKRKGGANAGGVGGALNKNVSPSCEYGEAERPAGHREKGEGSKRRGGGEEKVRFHFLRKKDGETGK